MNRWMLVLGLSVAVTSSHAQKKALDHTVYDSWGELKNATISNNGEWITVGTGPQVGDETMKLYNGNGDVLETYPRAERASFGPESNYVVLEIDPGYDTTRTLKLKKAKRDKMPNDSIFVRFLDSDSIIKLPDLKTVSIPEQGNHFLSYMEKSTYVHPKPKERKCKLFKRKKKEDTPKFKSDGKDLLLWNALTKDYQLIYNVSDYDLTNHGTHLLYAEHTALDTIDTRKVFVIDLETNQRKLIKTFDDKTTDLKYFKASVEGEHFAFYASQDTSKNKIYSLYHYTPDMDSAIVMLDTSSAGIPDGWCVGPSLITFSEDNKYMFFGIGERPYNEPKDTLLDSEKYKLDIWSWTDDRLQPQQLKERSRDLSHQFQCVYRFEDKQWHQIETTRQESMRFDSKQDHPYVLISNVERHEKSYSWAMPWLQDYYLHNIETGERTELKKDLGYHASLSIGGKYFVFYEHADSTWRTIHLDSNIEKIVSKGIEDELWSDNNGSPYTPGAYSNVWWFENDDAMMISSEHHLWKVDPDGKAPAVKLSTSESDSIRHDYIHWDRDIRTLNVREPLYASIFDRRNKDAGFVKIDVQSGKYEIIDKGPYQLSKPKKAKHADKLLWMKEDFKTFPDLMLSGMDLKNPKQLTDINPQMKDYKWGDVSLVKWNSYSGIPLEGLLYTPENLDPNKKYPMIVYFYERYDHQLHNHIPPRPTASIVFPTEYVSNDYVVFIPNIEYTPGQPGKSAYDCIVSGTDFIVDNYSFVDSTKLGLQGQSWGGYQTAFLITQTDKYAAAMAGAPVSNMTSAYGGIRWGGGYSRMFQYERTQSRIGYTIWDSLELYIENSPVFFAPEVETPLLIMHNDGDGAVPWYQGIEYFVALRRLNKPVWMLNYNDDEHNLMRRANRVDLSIRMKQFFDHYLHDQEAPDWLENGRPAVDKGRFDRY